MHIILCHFILLHYYSNITFFVSVWSFPCYFRPFPQTYHNPTFLIFLHIFLPCHILLYIIFSCPHIYYSGLVSGPSSLSLSRSGRGDAEYQITRFDSPLLHPHNLSETNCISRLLSYPGFRCHGGEKMCKFYVCLWGRLHSNSTYLLGIKVCILFGCLFVGWLAVVGIQHVKKIRTVFFFCDFFYSSFSLSLCIVTFFMYTFFMYTLHLITELHILLVFYYSCR